MTPKKHTRLDLSIYIYIYETNSSEPLKLKNNVWHKIVNLHIPPIAFKRVNKIVIGMKNL